MIHDTIYTVSQKRILLFSCINPRKINCEKTVLNIWKYFIDSCILFDKSNVK